MNEGSLNFESIIFLAMYYHYYVEKYNGGMTKYLFIAFHSWLLHHWKYLFKYLALPIKMHSLASIVGVVLSGKENYIEWSRNIKHTLIFIYLFGFS